MYHRTELQQHRGAWSIHDMSLNFGNASHVLMTRFSCIAGTDATTGCQLRSKVDSVETVKKGRKGQQAGVDDFKARLCSTAKALLPNRWCQPAILTIIKSSVVHCYGASQSLPKTKPFQLRVNTAETTKGPYLLLGNKCSNTVEELPVKPMSGPAASQLSNGAFGPARCRGRR